MLDAGSGRVKHGHNVHDGHRPPGAEQMLRQPLPALGRLEARPGGMALDDIVAVDQSGIAVSAVFGYTSFTQRGGPARHAAEHE